MPRIRDLFASFVLLACVNTGLASGQQLEFKMISSGSNRPKVALWATPMREILAGLHAGATPDQLAGTLGLSKAALSAKLDSLRAEGAVAVADGGLRPTCIVVTAEEGASLAALAATAAAQALPFVRQAVRDLQTKYREIQGFRHLEFDDVSFFLASDVLLDNWQIGAVESRWLRAERPLRAGSRYYCAIFERAESDREAFGIFGNQITGLAGGRLLGIYGNRRGGRYDLSSFSQAKLAGLTSLPDTTNRAVLLSRVVDQLQQLARTGAASNLSPGLTSELQTMGLLRQGRAVIAVLDTADHRRLAGLAASMTDTLVSFLEGATPQLRTAWSSSRWRAETTFEEFRIWWYHFFYTALTEQLAAEGAITIPQTGLFYYVFLP